MQQWNEIPQLNNVQQSIKRLKDYLLTLQFLFHLFSGQACRQSWNTHRMMHHHVLHTTLLTDALSSFYGSFYYYVHVHKPFSLYTTQNKSWITTHNLKAEYAWSMNIPIWFQKLLAFKKKGKIIPKMPQSLEWVKSLEVNIAAGRTFHAHHSVVSSWWHAHGAECVKARMQRQPYPWWCSTPPPRWRALSGSYAACTMHRDRFTYIQIS